MTSVTRMEEGAVLESVGGAYQVLLDRGDRVVASLRGRLKQEARTGDRVVAGDRVGVIPADDESWTIEQIEPRQTELVRSGPGGHRPKVVAANLDQVIIVFSAKDPPPRARDVDRFLVLAETNDLAALLVFNKVDLEGAADAVAPLRDMYLAVGYPVLEISARRGAGLEELRRRMAGRTSTLVGPSGVGKSSILNALKPGLDLRTGTVSRKARQGRHTTVSSRLLLLDGDIRVVDTPGFSDVSGWGVSPPEITGAFPEFRELADECRFRQCSHTHEPGCAVREALERGRIQPRRYESYTALLDAWAES